MTRIIVSHEDKLIWVAVAKVASMVIHGAITQKLNLPFNEWRRCSIPSLAQVRQMTGYFRFAFVRNPWARLFSCYRDKIVGPTLRDDAFILGPYGLTPGMPFEHFVRAVAEIDDAEADPHFGSQFGALSHQGQLAVDYVGRFENLPGDWDRLRPRYGLPELPWAPVGSRRRRFDFNYHKAHYTPELVEIVGRRYADDVRHFRYEY
jgi:hypothetical protein